MAMVSPFGSNMQTDRRESMATTRKHPVESSGAIHITSNEQARGWWIAVLLISFACFAGICIWLSAHRMMWDDEFDAWHLIADPSWRHALASWNAGADGGPPMYYAIGRLIVKITGLHPLALRLYSTACFWLAAILWVQIFKRHFGGTIAICAAAFAFLCNPEFIDQFAQVRFYGQLVLAFTFAVWVALYLEEKRPSLRRCFILSALAGAILVVSHPLGIFYSANIAAAQALSKAPWRNRITAVSGTVLSWGTLLIFLRGLRSGAQTTNWLRTPPVMAVVHFYNNYPLLFGRERYLSVLLNIALLCLIGYTCWWFLRRRNSAQFGSGSLWLLFCIAFAMMLIPVEFFAVSHLYKPLFLSRYMLPYTLGFAALAAAGTWLLTQHLPKRTSKGLAAVAAALIASFAVISVQEQARSSVSALEPLLRLAQSEPVVFQYATEILQTHYYTPSRAGNLFYVLLPPPPGERGTLNAVAAQGYEPEMVVDRQFLIEHSGFLYVETPSQPEFFERDLKGNPEWHSQYVGTVNLNAGKLRVFRYTRAVHP
jgi:Dolichyl-phosphate-mannose-protein mannosyltransferase